MPTHRITKPYTAKSRPIIFSAEMIRAILDGRKTQTRRVIKVEWSRCLDLDEPDDLQKAIDQCPYGKIDDFLWVRETITRRELDQGRLIGATYSADLTPVIGRGDRGSYLGRAITEWKWKRDTLPSIFMPRWASRISLRITDIRVERLQELSREDFLAEGIPEFTRAKGFFSDNPPDPRWKFIKLWDSINAKRGYSWESKPWVWVIEFEKIELESDV